jgi:hypothetical protein
LKRNIRRAIGRGQTANGLVLCDNCDTPASRSLSKACGWIGCGPCITGEAKSFDPKDLIAVEPRRGSRVGDGGTLIGGGLGGLLLALLFLLVSLLDFR